MVSGPAGFLFLSSSFLSLFSFHLYRTDLGKKKEKKRNHQRIARFFSLVLPPTLQKPTIDAGAINSFI